ncbi:MAG: hypothetical protein QOH93_2232 [Chloroflexia bacterium]|jgi:hypothetical protein|nr:hypothetical protein [Chloroflexia bacterium]
MFLALGFLATFVAFRGGFPFFFIFMMVMFICMARRGGRRGGWYNRSCAPQHNPWQGAEQQRQPSSEEARPYQAHPGAPGNPYNGDYASHGNEGTPTVRTDMNSGAGTVRVDSIPGTSGQPTTPLPEQPRARVQNDHL